MAASLHRLLTIVRCCHVIETTLNAYATNFGKDLLAETLGRFDPELERIIGNCETSFSRVCQALDEQYFYPKNHSILTGGNSAELFYITPESTVSQAFLEEQIFFAEMQQLKTPANTRGVSGKNYCFKTCAKPIDTERKNYVRKEEWKNNKILQRA